MSDRQFEDLLHQLLTLPAHGHEAPLLDDVEKRLTDGYAKALALEAERLRFARRIEELAAHPGSEATQAMEELSLLSHDLVRTDRELNGLRRTLADVRRRVNVLRAARAPA